jgi:anti-sigma factor RsiW
VSESHWLEEELIHQLGPVEAPEALWDRIQAPPVRRRSATLSWASWPVAALLAITAVTATVRQVMRAHSPAADLNALATEELRELGNDPQRLDFRSSDPVAIQTWVMTKTDLHLDLPIRSGAVQLIGARLIDRDGGPVAAVAYRVGAERAALLISRRGGGDPTATHLFTKRGGLSAWSMHGQVYALACSAKDPQVACLLCHADPEQRVTAN